MGNVCYKNINCDIIIVIGQLILGFETDCSTEQENMKNDQKLIENIRLRIEMQRVM